MKMADGCDSAESWNSRPFVERKEVMDWLKEVYTTRQATGNPQNHRYRIIGIHGKKGVGKSCVMQQFLQQIQHDTSRNETVHVESFDFDKVRSFQSFLNRLCTFFGVEMHKWRKESGNNIDDDEEEEEDFIECMSQIERKMKDNPSNKFIVFLDNMECACGKAKTDGTAPDMSKVFLWDKIYKEFIHNLLPKCHNLLVFITSTQTARFAEFGRYACKMDLKEMTEEEAECLLWKQVQTVITEKGSLSSIVRLCDGLPPTIIKAGAMLCDEEYTHEEIADLLKDFNNKRGLHGDDLFPKDDRYDEQLKKFINRLSDQNKRNLKSLAEMINTQGQVGIEDAASKLKFDRNTAVFKLRFLLPLRFRGMVEVDTKTRKISMNKFFCQFVLSCDIKGNVGKEDAVRPPCGYSPTSGGRISPHGHSTNPSDDGDDSDDQGPSANHLILASHHSHDKSTRLLEDQNSHDDADNQPTAAYHMTVPSHCTQDASSHLLEEVSMTRKLEPNEAKMEGQHFGNREEKPNYDITVTNQSSENIANTIMGNNDLSPEKSTNGNVPRNIAQPNQDLGSNGRQNSEEEKVTYAECFGEGAITNKQSLGEEGIAYNQISVEEKVMNEQKACPIKRSNTILENTRVTCKSQTGKDINMMSVEENYFQPTQVSGKKIDNIPEKKTNRAGSLDDNSQQDHCPVLSNSNKEKQCQEMTRRLPVDTDKANVNSKYYLGNIHSEQNAPSNDTGDDRANETLVKLPNHNINTSMSGHITALSQDRLSDTFMTGISEHVPSQQYDAMSVFGSRDQDDPLDSSFSSVRLFASEGFHCPTAIQNASRDEWPKRQPFEDKDVQCSPQHMIAVTRKPDGQTLNIQQEKMHVRSDNMHDEADPVGTTTPKPTVLPGYGKQGNGKSQQEIPPLGRELAIGIAPTAETRTVLSVHNETRSSPNGSGNTENHSQLTDDFIASVEQEGTWIFDSFFRVCRETFQIFKEMES
ncbi:uncharacterized protein LOC110442691 [Mizuhopecten yessoensis]|uniref:Uncharacterized protein n=1 Tax=Mizuhopecten yessoensis TaxID=6573 RepID=A0A210R0X4_MIZYE|nr:uncharacterized protein LOC110442691 [Mizuhopecten yessoensis]OWF54614.1 hypothetical protein KP79_PYT07760 [Mizuhopecten yessoensis]